MKVIFKQAHTTNFKAGRTDSIKYIAIHYTANNGDTAKNNVDHYANTPGLKASAHYYVDEYDTVYQSVKDTDTAWAVGGAKYVHPYCRNANCISIEMCSRNPNGKVAAADKGWYFKPETVNNAIALTKMLMAKYNIPAENVIRHYDITGKLCPAPFVNNPGQWEEFKNKLEVNVVKELESVNDIVWELAERGIITDKELWIAKLEEDKNAYWLARKTVNYIRKAGV